MSIRESVVCPRCGGHRVNGVCINAGITTKGGISLCEWYVRANSTHACGSLANVGMGLV